MTSSDVAPIPEENHHDRWLHLQRVACPSPNGINSSFEDAEDDPAVIVEDEHHLGYPTSSWAMPCGVPRCPAALTAQDAANFYQTAEKLSIPLCHVHDAVLETHVWYDKFSCYLNDREGGARNPSPEPEVSEEGDDLSPLDEFLCRSKRVRCGNDPRDLSCRSVSPPPETSTLVKPVAVRLFRSVPSLIQQDVNVKVSPLTDCARAFPWEKDQYSHWAAAGQTALAEDSISCSNNDTILPPGLIRPIAERPTTSTNFIERPILSALQTARDGLLYALSISGGDTDNLRFQECLGILNQWYTSTGADVRTNYQTEGTWLTLTKPIYEDCLGENDQGDPIYTLGRMGFDMYNPTDLICSLQGNFNQVDRTGDEHHSTLPAALQEQVSGSNGVLRTYNLLSAFTIEPPLAAVPSAHNRDVRSPIRGVMATEGYILPDPHTANRHSVWITAGRIEANDCASDQRKWKEFFAKYGQNRSFRSKAKELASKLFLGVNLNMDRYGMEYRFHTPLGGHGAAYVDTLYLDESLRIIKGHRGTIFVLSRLSGGSGGKSNF